VPELRFTPTEVVVVGRTVAELEPFIRFAVDSGLSAQVDRRRFSPERGAGSYPTVAISWGGAFEDVVDLLSFHLTLISIEHPGELVHILQEVQRRIAKNLKEIDTVQ
jgi:hypothetical protein